MLRGAESHKHRPPQQYHELVASIHYCQLGVSSWGLSVNQKAVSHDICQKSLVDAQPDGKASFQLQLLKHSLDPLALLSI